MARERVLESLVLARGELAAGRWHPARDAFASALGLSETLYGPDSEELIEPLVGLAKCLRSISKESDSLEEAYRLQSRALDIAERRRREATHGVSAILTSMAITCEARGDYGRGVEALQRAMQMLRDVGGDTSFLLLNIVHILIRANRGDEALPYAEEALASATRDHENPGDLLGPLIDVGLSCRAAGRLHEALSAFRRARAVALARPDVPELREVRAEAVSEIDGWIAEAEHALAVAP